MKVPVTWLYEHLDREAPVETLAEMLTMAGLEVEAVSSFEGRGGFRTPVLETYVTPNRGDLLSMVGVAREAAALLGCARKPVNAPEPLEGDLPPAFSVELEAPDLCPRYVGALVRGVEIGPSPDWLVNKIEAAGVRSISNIVDITNYVLLELGQPLHAFDFDELIGAQIIVRRAEPGEAFTLIDHTTRELDGEMLVIADAQGPIALAGVMGGLRSEISDATVNVLIESAHFHPASIRRTARIVGMASEASFRFERTVDPGGCVRAAMLAAKLMAELAGGEVVSPIVDAKAREFEPAPIALRPERCNALLGMDLDRETLRDCLTRLELPVEDGPGGALVVQAPTFRPDLAAEVDLIEEVCRIHGYDAVPERLPVTAAMVGGVTPDRARANRLREALLGAGLLEMVTHSITGADDAAKLGLPEDDPRSRPLVMTNALSPDYSRMRTQLLSSLIGVVARNQSHRSMDVAGFEISRVYLAGPDAESPPTEERRLGIVLTGSDMENPWNRDPKILAADFFRLKGVIAAALGRVSARAVTFEPGEEAPFDPSCCAVVKLEGERLGTAGRLSEEAAERFEASGDVYLCELDAERLLQEDPPRRIYQPLPRYPGALRDLAIVVDRQVTCERVEACIRGAGGELLRSVALFDQYDGKGIEKGKNSLAFSLEFRSPERTLTNEEVDASIEAIVSALDKELGAVLRS